MDSTHWKIIKSRQEHLSPLAQLVSKICLSFVLFHILKHYVFSKTSFIPATIFVLMTVSAIHRHFGRMPSRSSLSSSYNPSTAMGAPSISSAVSTSLSATSSSYSTTATTAVNSTTSSTTSSTHFNKIINNKFSPVTSSFSSFFSGLPFSSSSTSPDRQSLLNCITGMGAYKERTMSMISRRYALFSKMSFKHREIASSVGYLDRLNVLESRVLANERILLAMTQFAFDHYKVRDSELRLAKPAPNTAIIELLHHFVRDWSSDTVAQRNELFKPILTLLNKEFPVSEAEHECLVNVAQSTARPTSSETSEITTDPLPMPTTSRTPLRVLVPGSGLGRLAYEISRMGFQTDALEYSCMMDIAANFVFRFPEKLRSADNGNSPSTYFDFYPYIHDFSHQIKGQYQSRPSTIPEFELPEYLLPMGKKGSSSDTKKNDGDDDVAMNIYDKPMFHPTLRIPSTLSLGYGDFTQLVQQPNPVQKMLFSSDHRTFNERNSNSQNGKYDAVVTLFLIDTAENALTYMESIQSLLKPGGLWINYGPLKWGTAPQVEFTLEELEMVIAKMGFEIENKWEGQNEYNGDAESLWKGIYQIRGWSARKGGKS